MSLTSVKVRSVNGEDWGVYELSPTSTVEDLIQRICLRHTTYVSSHILFYRLMRLNPDKLVSWYGMKQGEDILIRDTTLWLPLQVRIVNKNVDFSLKLDPYYTIADLRRRIQVLHPEWFGSTPAECRLYYVGPKEVDEWMKGPGKWTMPQADQEKVNKLGEYGEKVFGLKRLSEMMQQE